VAEEAHRLLEELEAVARLVVWPAEILQGEMNSLTQQQPC
jgi:hypothetical protein